MASTLGYNPGANTISVGSSGAVTCTGITVDDLHRLHRRHRRDVRDGRDGRQGDRVRSQLRDMVRNARQRPDQPELEVAVGAHGIRPRQEPDRARCGDVVRKATALVPVVIPDSTSVPPGTTAIDWIYGLNDVTFGQSVNVAAPVYAGHDLILENTATIAETIPASLTLPARPNRIVVGHDLSLVNPQNQVGHVNGSASPANDLAEIHVGNYCNSQANATPHPCACGEHRQDLGRHHTTTSSRPALITTPTLTCCSAGRPARWAGQRRQTARRIRPPPTRATWASGT